MKGGFLTVEPDEEEITKVEKRWTVRETSVVRLRNNHFYVCISKKADNGYYAARLTTRPSRNRTTSFGQSSFGLSTDIPHHRQPVFENSFRLSPDSKPDAETIRNVMKKTISDIGSRWSSSFPSTNGMTLQITRNLNINLKQCIPGRYRFTIQTYVFEKCGQGIAVASSFLWDKKGVLLNRI
ncbi:Oidioi.mRNA.OKI2018_I69.XSR.g15379.t1.cds [Oikopleura dioica]|uniref:Oidioi.mRNA.OKI2018_I69.XSR.g15379.t1.cds n=1 Tax=Oikopleura dioica TaxID=34765 RepID=A0ABN7SK43_OIKDI|nr:Oidioi.mRNA.OKI2018_I69.XSR.g15379.t1.cds [Oikopleura dioica]